MEKKNYTVITNTRSARPRSKRLRETGGSSVTIIGGSSGGTGDAHTHPNKGALDALSIDKQDYLFITQIHEDEEVPTTEKVKAGLADKATLADRAAEADHADKADRATNADDSDKWDGHHFKDYLDQPVREVDSVTFEKVTTKELQTPNFASGLAGVGGRIDGNGAAELESLFVRRFLETPELRYNRVDVGVGDKWSAPGGGIIRGVNTTAKVITLKLEPGEIGSLKVGDICMGIFRAANPSLNASANHDDSRGNRRFAGFATCYFRVTEELGEDGVSFRYELRPASDNYPAPFAPCEAMTVVAYGSFTDPERRTSRYETRTYQRYLRGVSDWEFSASNIAAQFGDLKNLSVHGLEMSGYSAYLNNIYMSGVIRQFTPDGVEVPTIVDCGPWVEGTIYAHNEDVYHNNCRWRCLVDGTTSEPSAEAPEWVLLQEAVDGDDALQVTIFSSNGNTFKNGEIAASLTAVVTRGGEEISDAIAPNFYSWERISKNPDTDKIFNQTHRGHGRVLTITPDDVFVRATFDCKVTI